MNQMPTHPHPSPAAGASMFERTATFAASALLALAALAAPYEAHAEPSASDEDARVYTLIVAHNGSVDEGVEPLRYADDDGARYYETFSHLADETRLLTVLDADSQRIFPEIASISAPPTTQRLSEEVEALARKIDADRAAGRHVEVYLVFTGHGNIDASGEGYLSLADGKLRRSDLYREVIRPLDADFTHLIIDACHAYFMVQSRGGHGEGWRDDRSGQTLDRQFEAYLQRRKKRSEGLPSTVGVILSTSGTAEVHEWSKLRAGVFSHQLRSGLLGAADVDGDGAVDYLELEAFLAAANASVTNPKARISVFARPPKQDRRRPLVRLDDYRDATTLELPETMQGRYHVEDARGVRYADLHLSAQQPSRLVLLHAPVDGRDYYLRGEDVQATIPLAQKDVDASMLAYAEQPTSARSSVEESFRMELFSTPFGPSFYAGYLASRDRYESLLEERANTPDQTDSAWETKIDAGYAVNRAQLGYDDAIQHVFTLGVPFLHASGWNIGPHAEYGVSLHDGARANTPDSIHRVHLGAALGKRFSLTQRLWLEPAARLGYQMILLADDSGTCGPQGVCSDPMSLRGSTALRLGWRVTPDVDVRLGAGVAADFISQVREDRALNNELSWTPSLNLGVTF